MYIQKIFILLATFTTFLYASYNPFFSGDIAAKVEPKKAPPVKIIIQKPKKVIPQRKNIKMEYIGYIESKKGKFALVTFEGKNIIIRQNDLLYSDEKIFKINKITTNYILLRDRNYRNQKVYFTTSSQYGSR